MTTSIRTGQHLGSYGSTAALLQLPGFSSVWSTTVIWVIFSISTVMHTNHGPGSLLYVPTYRILSSKRPSPCKRPPWPYGVIHIMTCLCKHPPQFLARQFQVPMGAYSREYSTTNTYHTIHVAIVTINFYHWESDITSLVIAMIPLQHHSRLPLHMMKVGLEYMHDQAHTTCMVCKYPSIREGSPHNVCTVDFYRKSTIPNLLFLCVDICTLIH